MNHEHRLTAAQCRQVRDALALGCDRATASHFAGATLDELQATLDADDALAREFARAEAKPSVRHLANLHEAVKDEKNWRISVWWLEQRDQQPAREEPAKPGEHHLRELVEALASVVVEVIPDVTLQRKLVERLYEVVTGDDGGATQAPRQPIPRLVLPHIVLDQDATSFGSGDAVQ